MSKFRKIEMNDLDVAMIQHLPDDRAEAQAGCPLFAFIINKDQADGVVDALNQALSWKKTNA